MDNLESTDLFSNRQKIGNLIAPISIFEENGNSNDDY
jgi:hypothetical protein